MPTLSQEEIDNLSGPKNKNSENKKVESGKDKKPVILKCEKCKGEMMRKRKATGTGPGCILIIIGAALLFLFPIGSIIGILLIFVGLYYGSKAKGLWVCKKCGYQFERKIKWHEFG